MAISGCHFGVALALSGASGAQAPYVAGTLAREIGAKSVRTIGCLDVGFVPSERNGTARVDFHVGNRCGHPEALDLRRLVVRAWDVSGTEREVTLLDPRDEIARLHVGGAERGRERIRLDAALGSARLCFDVERIDPDAPAARPRPLCFDRNRDGWTPA